jgi:hypothetical protein
MPRVIVSEPSPGAESHIPVVLAWGWNLHDSLGWEQAAATIEVGGSAVGLSWGDLERLNKSVRRAMKHYRKAVQPSALPAA